MSPKKFKIVSLVGGKLRANYTYYVLIINW